MPVSNSSPEIIALLRQRLVEMPLIVLSKPLDPQSQLLNVQDYVIDGETVIPLFSSRDALQQSAGGQTLGQGVIEIARKLLAEVSRGHEIYLLDPRLPGEIRFTALDLRLAFPVSPEPV